MGTPLAVAPTRTRYRVVTLATLLAMITYLDRVCISKLAPDIMRDLGLSKIQMGYVFSTDILALDPQPRTRHGARRVLRRRPFRRRRHAAADRRDAPVRVMAGDLCDLR